MPSNARLKVSSYKNGVLLEPSTSPTRGSSKKLLIPYGTEKRTLLRQPILESDDGIASVESYGILGTLMFSI